MLENGSTAIEGLSEGNGGFLGSDGDATLMAGESPRPE
jgi:hypothetical protein